MTLNEIEIADDELTLDISTLLKLPEPILITVLHNLRFHDLIALKDIIPELTHLINLEINRTDKEFHKRRFFKFERCAPSELEEEMTPRKWSSMAYCKENGTVYLFGGDSVGNEENTPAFNDLWQLNMVTMKWSRVLISTTPYPSPKCGATLVAWKEKLVLFGGSRPYFADGRLGPPRYSLSEMHMFDIHTSTWQYIPNHQGPHLCGHSAVVSNNLMFVFGGADIDELRLVYMFDLEAKVWHRQVLTGAGEFPSLDPNKSKLIIVREGLLLITGEMTRGDYGISILVEYNPMDPLSGRWKWKTVETTGRWWKEKIIHGQPNILCTDPNWRYHEIAEVRCGNTIRLVSLGKLKNDVAGQSLYSGTYEVVQRHYRRFCQLMKNQLEEEFQRRDAMDSDALENESTDFSFQYSNISCLIKNCFLPKHEILSRRNTPVSSVVNQQSPKLSRPNYHKFKVSVRTTEDPEIPRMDDFDKWETRASIRAIINQLYAKFYNVSRMDTLAARVPMRNSALRRLAIYTTEINSDVTFENFQKLEWIPHPCQYYSPAETEQYSLIGAHHEVIMHGGSVEFNGSMKRMGSTTLLIPSSSVESKLTSAGWV